MEDEMKYLAALTALGLLASTTAYAQNSQGTDQQSSSPATSSQATSQQTGAQPLSQQFVRQIQMRLRQQGVYDGKPTGAWDDQTTKAVQNFQQANNIQPTGQIDGATIIALMRPAQSDMDEGSSAPPTGAMGGNAAPTVRVIPLMRIYEHGYQQGFAQGLRWAQQAQQQEEQGDQQQ
jgi:peptidoglycan hydrolase-like protein with peptidoglycan-binding domain